jgi:hypothetical protein
MKNVLVFALGTAAGFVAAHFVSQSPRGKQFFEDVNDRTSEFVSAVADGYRMREAELKASLAEVQDVISDATDRGK